MTVARRGAFSGDTTPLEAVAHLAKGADVLVQKAMYLMATDAPLFKGIPALHCPAFWS